MRLCRIITMYSSKASGLLLVLLILQSALLGSSAKHQSFCPLTLSRPTCPDLPTYDKFDITTYGGRWFEIGSTANFKNLQESGGICVVANYTLLKPPSSSPADGGAEVKVVNSLYSLGASAQNVSQVVISISAGQICSQAFSICAETEQEKSSKSSLAQALVLISSVTSSIGSKYSSPAAALASSKKQMEGAIKKIDAQLDCLAKGVSKIQELDAQLGQGQSEATELVAALVGTVAESNGTLIAIASAVGQIDNAKESVANVAAELLGYGEAATSAQLYQAVELISEGEAAITAQLGKIRESLASVVGVAGLFLAPRSEQKGYSSIVGTGQQNVSFAGKLVVTFPSFSPGQYWVLGVEEGGPNGGYSASLVYGCDQNGGGIEETLFILSRTPSLPKASAQRLLAKASALGVTNYCSTPFIFTVQDSTCGIPPAFRLTTVGDRGIGGH